MSGARPLLACLLPVRNGADDLPGYLECAARVCDLVIALDDGSTDATPELLRTSPLVARILENPQRTTYAGWDDAANRRRLLAAADEFAPQWVLWLDADERIDPDEAAALRAFLDTDALPGFAFGLRHFRMWGDRYDPNYTWIYRLFAHRPGRCFLISAFTSTLSPSTSRCTLGWKRRSASGILARPLTGVGRRAYRSIARPTPTASGTRTSADCLPSPRVTSRAGSRVRPSCPCLSSVRPPSIGCRMDAPWRLTAMTPVPTRSSACSQRATVRTICPRISSRSHASPTRS